MQGHMNCIYQVWYVCLCVTEREGGCGGHHVVNLVNTSV